MTQSELHSDQSSSPKSGKRKANQRSNRESMHIELLDQAAKTLNRAGVSQASLASVAENLGTTRAALYYYVDNQEDLVYQCYIRTCEQLAGLLDRASAKHSNALDILHEFIACSLDENRAEFASLSDIAFLQEEKRSIVRGLYKGVRASLADIIALGVERGELRQCDARIVASILIALITWTPAVLLWKAIKEAPKTSIIKTLQDIVSTGVGSDIKPSSTHARYDLESFVKIPGNFFDTEFRAAARKEALLVSASWLFSQKGVDATSLDEVALRVGVTKKVIYRSMGTKDNLVSECYSRGFRFLNFVADGTENFEGSRIDALGSTLATLAEASIRHDIAPFVPHSGLDGWQADARNEVQDFAANLIQRYDRFFRKGIDEGSLRSIDTHAIMTLIPGAYEWMPRWIDTFRDSEKGRIPDEIANFMCRGLGPI